ncbi:helix-turn-helix domain-containing protein [Nakamurella alba]|nr:helix-turn-helix domain-containing protein [Nakamurella alba]
MDDRTTPDTTDAHGWPDRARRIGDPETLRAYAHPLRVRLMSVLAVHGPMTATQAAQLVDDSPSNCSFHLRKLAAAGLIEEAPGPDARSRVWRKTTWGVRFEPDGTAESMAALATASQVLHQDRLTQLARWMEQAPDAPEEWQEAGFDNAVTLSATPAELTELSRRITELVRPLVAVDRKDSDPDRRPITMSYFAFPHLEPGPGNSDPGPSEH